MTKDLYDEIDRLKKEISELKKKDEWSIRKMELSTFNRLQIFVWFENNQMLTIEGPFYQTNPEGAKKFIAFFDEIDRALFPKRKT